jgi:PAS domain S-box-containing protein
MELFPKDNLLREMNVQAYIGTPLFDSTGEPLGVMAVLFRERVDDTSFAESVLQVFSTRVGAEIERARVVGALRQSEAFLKSTGSAGKVGGWDLDTKTGEVRWSEAMYEIYEVQMGFPLTLESISEFFVPEDRLKLERIGRRAVEHGETYDVELRLDTARGRRIWVNAIGRPQMVDGEAVKVIGTMQDITARKKAESALRMSQHSLDASSNMIFWLGADLSFFYVNDAGCKAVGYSREELLQMSVPDVDPIFTHDKWETERWWDRFREAGSTTFESMLRRKDGSTFPVEITANFVMFEGEEYLFAFLVDITERKRAETQLRDLAIQLSAVEERERRTVATYLHDQIGQTLAVLRMRLGALSGKSESESTEAIEDIRNLLDETIDDTRTLTFDLSPPILYELGLAPAVEWAVEKICNENGLEFEFDEEGDEPINPDTAAQLFRSARELLMNVVKHAQATRVSVAVIVERGAGVRISVRDDGVGFDVEKTLSHPREAGYGLLSIRERMRFIGGRVEIDSAPAGGTRVTLLVPAAALLPRAETAELSVTPPSNPDS